MSGRPLPRLAIWLLTRRLSRDWHESIVGDLEEERQRRLDAGRAAGFVWACASAVRIAAGMRMARGTPARQADPERRRHVMNGVWADIRQAARGLRKNRGYAATAVLTLALGIGANAAVFNLANWLLLRPLPGVTAPDHLVTIGYGSKDGTRGPLSVPDLESLKAGVPALTGLAGYQPFQLHVTLASGDPIRVSAEVVSSDYFDVLNGGVGIGRRFSREEGTSPAAAPVVIISHRLWTSDYGGDAGTIGRSISVNGHAFTIIGIAARGFHGTTLGGATDVWVPIAQHKLVVPQYPDGVMTSRRSTILFGLVGRLADGASVDAVAAQAEIVRTQILAANPNDKRMQTWRFNVQTGVESRPWIRERLNHAMSLLMGIVGLLLLLTSANVANLMLARSTERRGEIATRLTLGASRLRVARLLLTESVLLSFAAGATALAFAHWAGRALEGTVVVQGLPPLDRAELDWRVFGFAFVVSTVMAIVAGVMPAVAGSRFDVNAALRESGRSQTARRRLLRRVLTSAQVAISITLLVGAVLLLRSMTARLSVDPGFNPSAVLSFSIEPGLQGYEDGPREEAFYRDVLDRVRQVPGVRAAGLAWLQPYSPNAADTSFVPDDQPTREEIDANLNNVSPGFFDALGLAVVEGRDFSEAEFQRKEDHGNGVVVLTEGLARKTFGGGPAVGRRIVMSYPKGVVRTVVGVVRDTRQRRLIADSADMLFQPFDQQNWASVLVGLAGPEETVVPALRRAIRTIDPTLPIYDVVRLDRAIQKQFADDILVMRLTMVFAGLATVLAGIGLYGVLARGVAERRREFSIRTALGARPATIGALVTSEALRLAAVGMAAGLIATYWLSGFLTSRLFGVTRFDPLAFGASVALVIAMTLLSAVGPARRAARLDPAAELK